MPHPGLPGVPPVDSASASVAPAGTLPDSARPALALRGCRYDSVRAMVEIYCADCHSSRGDSPSRERAHRILSVDTYSDWIGAARAVPGRVDKDSLEGRIMPPPRFRAQPSDAQRRLLVDWVKRGSPNTPDGK